jgi:hypothetical protein
VLGVERKERKDRNKTNPATPALPQKSDLSFTPGFSPVITSQNDWVTVSTVFFLAQVTEAFECEEVTSVVAKEKPLKRLRYNRVAVAPG